MANGSAASSTCDLSHIKCQFERGASQSLDEALDYEAAGQALMTWTDDFKEGTTAFKEKRKPVYRGA